MALTFAGVCVAQGLLGVQAQADLPPAGGRRAVAGARALVVTAAASHRALGPGRPAGPRPLYWEEEREFTDH